MYEAQFFITTGKQDVICSLCPHNCLIAEGKRGICGVRINMKGTLYTEVYNRVSSINPDPIEKKPLYHFHPGKNILSIGSIGCNLKCNFCQNYIISQYTHEATRRLVSTSDIEIIKKAKKLPGNIGIAYTYNEPFVNYEFMYDCAILARRNKLKNVIISNGFINPGPLKKILPFIDAFNIDLKAFNNSFYRKNVKGQLQPVLETLKIIAGSGKHLEITFLVITGLNDNSGIFKEMAGWISSELGKHIPLHISRYFPANKQTNNATSMLTLENFYDIASGFLDYVFLGNIHKHKKTDTYCPGCGKTLIERDGYSTKPSLLLEGSKCLNCGNIANIIN